MERTPAHASRLVNLQYELALLVGQELRLIPMLRRFLPYALKALSCRAAHIWLSSDAESSPDLRYSYPARDTSVWRTDARFAEARTLLCATPTEARILEIGPSTRLYLAPLGNVGCCVLVREGEPLDPMLVEAVRPIFERLATACRASLNHERIEHLQAVAAEGEQRLRDVLETVGEAIFQTDQNGALTFLNPAWERISGKAIRACLGLPITRFLSPKDMGKVEAAIHSALYKGQESLRLEVRLYLADETFRWVAMRIRPRSQTADGKGVTGTLIDLTDVKQAERMKREFTATVSHELRTPLTSIAGAIGLLNGGLAGTLPESARNLIAIADRNVRRLRALIDDLLDMEKLLAGKLVFSFQHLELKPLLEQALNEHQPFADSHGVRLRLTTRTGRAHVYTDPGRFQQVLNNLLSNAVKFSPTGGEVEVRAHPIGASVRVEVRDQGPGIDPAFQSKIFERFAQADASDTRSQGGTGLGLAITEALIGQMHGTIAFESVPGQGTNFWFELPASRPSAPADNSVASSPENPRSEAEIRPQAS